MNTKEINRKLVKYATLVREKFSPKKIILFGSYARGNFTENSDIDIAVIVYNIEDDFLDLEFQLFKLRRDIDDRIEPVLLEENNDRSGFLESILEYGKVIYSC
ncbi:MAG: nucleotidyltransferase domain-containing protein [Candidatus Cloacimonetes bacterium]|nr:nucleotidyltransferase domain-containing protein [Candidatus Cloacimonadota bacterium]